MKKMLCAILAVCMLLSIAVPAMALTSDQKLDNATSGETTVKATAKIKDPEYTITIPLYADFNKHNAAGLGLGSISQGETGSYPITFAVTMGNAKYFNGKQMQITYSGEGANGELVMKNEKGQEIPFYVQTWPSHPEWDDEKIFSVLEQNSNTENAGGAGLGRTLRVNRSDITAAGDFSGKMYFTFTMVEPE